MFQKKKKVVEKIKTCILRSVTFSPKLYPLWGNVEKYGSAKQTTYDNMVWRMRFLSLITKAAEAHSEYGIRIAIQRQQWLRERNWVLLYT